jgi:hypothetical protein
VSRRTPLIVFILLLLGTLSLAVPAARLSSASIAAKKTLRVMTYNIHVGVGMDKKLDLERIADVIGNEHPDLVGLQEVDRAVKRTELRDEILELAKLTGMDYAFAHNLDFQGGPYVLRSCRGFRFRKLIIGNMRISVRLSGAGCFALRLRLIRG